jgi:hypothetical protein
MLGFLFLETRGELLEKLFSRRSAFWESLSRLESCLINMGSVRFGSIRFCSVRFDSIRVVSVRFVSVRVGSFLFVSVRFGSFRFGSVRFGSCRFGSGRFVSVRFGSRRFAIRFRSVRFDSIRFGSVRFVSVRVGSFLFVSVRFGSFQFGSLRFGGMEAPPPMIGCPCESLTTSDGRGLKFSALANIAAAAVRTCCASLSLMPQKATERKNTTSDNPASHAGRTLKPQVSGIGEHWRSRCKNPTNNI